MPNTRCTLCGQSCTLPGILPDRFHGTYVCTFAALGADPDLGIHDPNTGILPILGFVICLGASPLAAATAGTVLYVFYNEPFHGFFLHLSTDIIA